MQSHQCFSLLKGVTILIVSSLLAACATNSNPSSSDKKVQENRVPTSACIGNAYLQKYNCSVRRINQAAQSGDPDAQYALGYMYYYGIGTIRDKETAKLWINRAADQSQPLAKKASELIENGGHFRNLHRQGAPISSSSDGTGTAQGSGSASSSGSSRRSRNKTRYAPTPSVKELNAAVPDKPLNEVLPNYGGDQQTKPKSVIKSLQKKSNDNATTTNMDSGSKVEPITSLDKRLTPKSVPTTTALSEARNAMTAVETRMMEVPKQHFALQLMGGRNLNAIKAFVKKNDLAGKAHYYSAQLNHETWYMLVYGDYSSDIRAHAALRDLAPALRQLHPWVKSYRIIQDEIRMRRVVS